jgi:zinc protease
MNRRFAVMPLALMVLAWALPAMAADEAPPAAETILDRYVEVTGGKAAYEKHKTEIETGKLEFTALGLKGPLTSYSAEPGQHYSSLDLEGVGKVEMGVSGGVAWENNSISGPRIKTGEEERQALRDARINAPNHWRELYSKATTAGAEIVEGEDCYKVLLTPAEGNPVTMYFGKKSGLMKKTTVVATSPQGDIPAEMIVSEYREFGGILLPAKTIEKAAGQEFTITIDDVKVNQEIPPERFELPSGIKALLNR